MAAVVIGATAAEVAIDDARLRNENATTNLEVELALRHGRHLPTAHAIGVRRNLHTVTNGGDRFVLREEILRDANQILIVSDVLWSPPTGEQDAEVFVTSTLRLVTVDLVTGLSDYGEIDHSDLYNSDPESYWYYRDVRRSIFMGDYIYAISDRGITVHDLQDLQNPVTQQPLPGYTPDNWYWWW